MYRNIQCAVKWAVMDWFWLWQPVLQGLLYSQTRYFAISHVLPGPVLWCASNCVVIIVIWFWFIFVTCLLYYKGHALIWLFMSLYVCLCLLFLYLCLAPSQWQNETHYFLNVVFLWKSYTAGLHSQWYAIYQSTWWKI